MPAITLKPNIFWIGVNDRTTDLFEGIWPIAKEGVSYNAYLVRDKKTAIIDLSKSIKSDSFFDQIEQVCNVSEIDYIVLNHMEPDHTGVINILRKLAPNTQILCTTKAKKMLADYYQITDNIREVADGEEISLGEKTLQFFHVPFVHWPETMVTYEKTQKVLFSCDAFGGYGALRGAIFDDECRDFEFYKNESLRYFVNIIAKFTGPVLKAIEKLKGLSISIIAPSHGLVFRKDPGIIVELYKKWAEYAVKPGEKEIALVYGSMYGNTETMMNAVAQGISNEGVPVQIFDAARTHSSYILPALWTSAGVMLGAPTYEGKLYPPITGLLDMAITKMIRNKTAAMFGSFGWSGGALAEIKRITEPAKWDMTMTYEFQGGPTPTDLKKGEVFGAEFAKLVKSIK
ncbi:MAG: FprA family A-type flavoprotein [Spirochaetaceae bacterium]|nr:MAG: FprA family A-type flavoprotein [Spirochaetaceae bacterium]